MGAGLTAQQQTAMKKLILLLLLVCPFLVSAQELVSFKVTPEGNFVTTSGEDFVVVPFDGKDAHQIYQMLASNVGSVFNDPSKVMSGVDDASIKIRAFSDNIYTKKVMGIPHAFQGYYQIEFRIKDGRVRVSAPFIEDDLRAPSLSSNAFGGNNGSFRHIVKKWFKDGALKDKEAPHAANIEMQMNGVINGILGLSGSASKVDDDW